MTNVIQFPGNAHLDSTLDQNINPAYAISVYPTPDGFDWTVDNDGPLDEDLVASDLAAIALQLRPPPRSFIERLAALIFGDE